MRRRRSPGLRRDEVDAYDVRFRPSPDEFFRQEPWNLAHPRVERTLVLFSPADAETSHKFRGLLDRGKQSADLYLVPA